MSELNKDEAFDVLISAMGSILEEDDGIVVHHDDNTFLVYMEDNSINIQEDPDVKHFKNGQFIKLLDGPVGHA